MKTKGKRTIEETINVEVDAGSFLRDIYERSIPSGLDHLGSDGYWYKQDGFDYHKREDLYAKARKATSEELEFQKAYHIMYQFAKDNKL
jgi:hypothetical protein